ncbi:MAG: hypothetical protein ACK5QT_05625 [Oligoflexia bacterium]
MKRQRFLRIGSQTGLVAWIGFGLIVGLEATAFAEQFATHGCAKWRAIEKKRIHRTLESSIVGCESGVGVFYTAATVDAKIADLEARITQTNSALSVLSEKEGALRADGQSLAGRIERTQESVLTVARDLDQRVLNEQAIAQLRAELKAELKDELKNELIGELRR